MSKLLHPANVTRNINKFKGNFQLLIKIFRLHYWYKV